MHKGVTIIQTAGKLIDDEYLKIATGERDTYAGFVLPSNDGLMVAPVRASDPHDPASELMQIVKDTNEQLKAENKTKDSPLILFLASTDALHDDDMQPHVLLRNDKKQAQLVAFLEGEFEEEYESLSEQSPQHHTPEFFAANELINKVADIHRRTNSLVKTVEELKQPNTRKEIIKSLRKSADSPMAVTFIAENGDVFSFDHKNTRQEFSWGSTSHAFGYEEKKTATPVVSSKSVFGTPATPSPAPTPQPAPNAVPDNLPAGPPAIVPEVPAADDPVIKYKDVLFLPGPSVEKKRNVLKGFYKHLGGDQILGELDKIRDINGDWQSGTARFKVREKMRSQIDKALAEGRLVLWTPRPIAAVEPITQAGPAVSTSTSGDEATRSIPMLLKPEERQKLEVLLPRIVAHRDEKGQLIFDPTKLSEAERNIPTIGEQIGKPDALIPLSGDQWDIVMSIGPAPAEIMAKNFFLKMQAMAFKFKALYELELEKNKKPLTKSAFG